MPVFTLWSAPRARSTAFFRSMLERGDLLALHEPLEGLIYFGTTEVEGRRYDSPQSLVASLLEQADNRGVFLKETTDHRVLHAVRADKRLLAEGRHAFLIRRPEEIAISMDAVVTTIQQHDPGYHGMALDSIGLEALHDLYTVVNDVSRHAPVIIDSDDLVARPAATMAAYCAAVGLPFLPHALTWVPGERPEWQRTARWHVQVSRTSGFEPRRNATVRTDEISDELAAYAAHHRPFYERLYAMRLPVGPGQEV